MKAQRHYLRRMLAYVMTLCIVLSLFGGAGAAGIAQAAEDYVYFLNSEGWSEVGAYVYGDKGEVLGGWGSTTAAAAEELGGNWLKVAVSEVPPYSIIFFNKADDSQRTEQYLPSEDNVYVTMDGSSYTTKAAAEAAMGIESDEDYVYFLNSANWENVGAYVYGDKGEVLGGWGSATAVPAEELGGDWVKVEVSELPPYNIIFFNKDKDSERAELYLPTENNIYVTVAAQSYTSKEAAEEASNATPTTIYILNYDGENTMYDDIYVYAYADGATVGSGWPGVKAEESDIGDNWMQVSIPANASASPFTVIVHDNGDNRLEDIDITSYNNNYITLNGKYSNQTEAEASVGITFETVMYYLNSYDWPGVNAYVYGLPGEALGSWPGTPTEPAPEKGEKWVKVTVPAKTPFNIIFFNTSSPDAERAELLISDSNMIYVAGSKSSGDVGSYSRKLVAELAMGLGDESMMTTLHFYNYRNWDDVNGYFFTKENEDAAGIALGAGWPGKAAEDDNETGDNWYKSVVPQNADEESFYAVFNNGVRQTEDILITNKRDIYITPGGQKFDNAADAEAAAALESTDDGCETGPNADLEGYDVSYNGAGAALPYITYEAEAAQTNAELLPDSRAYRQAIQSEASGRQAVKLNNTGDYVTFTLTEAANSIVMRYCMPDSTNGAGLDNTLSLYVNQAEKTDLNVTSRYAWVYGGYPYYNSPSSKNAHRFFDETRILLDETLVAGTTITIKKDAADDAEYYIIDFIECELVGAPLPQPENSLSITDFGAVADDGMDDYDALEACIDAAKAQGKEVWIPVGNFDLVEKKYVLADSVTIRGAGMWYSNLRGAGTFFRYQGTSKFYDFAMTGVVTHRDDSGDAAGFEGNGYPATNITIQNLWMEHIKVGVWAVDTDRMVIQGCRIRDTYADGVNLCSGTNNTTIRNNSIRNTGDDGLAIWPWLVDCSNNTIEHNTVQLPMLANGIAVYGGGNNVVDSNHVADIINNGAGIVTGSEFEIRKGFTGPIYIKNNVMDRCGSMQTDENYQIGAIWIWASFQGEMTTGYYIDNNVMNNSSEVGITIENNNRLTNLHFTNNTIDGAKDAIFEYLHAGGEGTYSNMTVRNITGVFDNDQSPEFILTEVDEPDEPAEEFAAVVEGEDYITADTGVSVKNFNDEDLVCNIASGTNLTYTITVPEDGYYRFDTIGAMKYKGKSTIIVQDAGKEIAKTYIACTDDWGVCAENEGTVAFLKAGTHDITLLFKVGHCNIDKLSVVAVNYDTEGTICVEAESFEECNGVDTVVRETKVDTAIVNNINNGDTMTYVVNVAEEGEYRFDAVAASPRAWTSIISLNEDGQELARAEITSTGDWNVFNTFEGSTVYLTEGTHTFVLKAVKSGFNLDKFTLTK